MEGHETSKADLHKNVASTNRAILHPPILIEGPFAMEIYIH